MGRTLPPPGGDWVGIAANAGSGRGEGRKRVDRLLSELERLRMAPRVSWTPAERAAMVADAAGDSACRCLVAAGGDGTVGALVNERPTVPIAVFPTGTENLFARHFGFDNHPETLAAVIAEGRLAPLDLGVAGDRRFTLMAGVGFDADVVTRHHTARTSETGKARPTNRAAYVEPVIQASINYRFPPLRVTVENRGTQETLIGTSALVFNLPRYALGLPFAPSARGDDGLLDLVLFKEPGAFRALGYFLMVLQKLHLKQKDVYHRRTRRASITCDREVPVQLDGDPAGAVPAEGQGSPWTAEVMPNALEVVVPAAYAKTRTR